MKNDSWHTSRFGVVLVAALVTGVAGCGDNGSVESKYSVQDVERAFRTAGVELVRQSEGIFRVGTNDEPYCEELYTTNGRLDITVCRDSPALMRLKFLPRLGEVRQFRTADDVIAFLHSNAGDDVSVTPLFVLDDRNVTVTYVGRDVARVKRVVRAVDYLRRGE